MLALGASLCLGLANFVGPLQARRRALEVVLVIGQAAAAAGAVAILVTTGEAWPGIGPVAVGVLAGLGMCMGIVGIYRAAETAPLSLTVPLSATGAVLAVAYGLLGGEALSSAQLAGIACAFVGVVMATWRRPEGAELTQVALWWAAVSAVGTGLMLIALPAAAEHGRWWALADGRLTLLTVVVVWLVTSGTWRAPRAREFPVLVLPGLLLLLGTFMYTLAAERGLLSVVSVVISLNPVFTVALAFVFLGERLAPSQWIGIQLALLGVGLIAT